MIPLKDDIQTRRFPALTVGQAFTDPNFGTTIRRVTNVAGDNLSVQFMLDLDGTRIYNSPSFRRLFGGTDLNGVHSLARAKTTMTTRYGRKAIRIRPPSAWATTTAREWATTSCISRAIRSSPA